jgi:hypothetical protein
MLCGKFDTPEDRNTFNVLMCGAVEGCRSPVGRIFYAVKSPEKLNITWSQGRE